MPEDSGSRYKSPALSLKRGASEKLKINAQTDVTSPTEVGLKEQKFKKNIHSINCCQKSHP